CELVALRSERVRLRLKLLLLALSLLLLLLELLLQAHRLLVLARVLAALFRRCPQLDGHEKRAVVADAETLRQQVVGLALGGRLRRGADVLLAEVQREERDDQRDQECEHAEDRPPRAPRQRARPAAPEPALEILRRRPEEGGYAYRFDVRPDD